MHLIAFLSYQILIYDQTIRKNEKKKYFVLDLAVYYFVCKYMYLNMKC